LESAAPTVSASLHPAGTFPETSAFSLPAATTEMVPLSRAEVIAEHIISLAGFPLPPRLKLMTGIPLFAA